MTSEHTLSKDGQAFDPAAYCPEQVPDAQCIDRGPEEPPESRFVLTRANGRRQVVISAEDRNLWALFDGQSSVNTICETYLSRHRTLVLTRVYSLIQRLWQARFLRSDPHIAASEESNRAWPWKLKLAGWFRLPLFGTEFLVKGLASALRPLPLESVVGMGIVLLLAVTGLITFGNLPAHLQYPLLKISQDYQVPVLGHVAESYLHGLLLLAVLHLLFSFLRNWLKGAVETAFTQRATPLCLQLNYGIPVFTTQSRWTSLLPLRQRLIVAGSGIVCELVLAAVGAILLVAVLDTGWAAELLYKALCILYLRVFLHFSPLPGSDFPQLLQELSNVKDFRQRALGFFRHSFIGALSGELQLALQHRYYIAYNIVSVFWLCLAAVFSLALLTANLGVLRNLAYVFINAEQLQATRDAAAQSPIIREMMLLAEARYLLAFLMALFLLLVVLSFLLAGAWGIYVFGKWLERLEIWKIPTLLVSAALALVILFLVSLTFLVKQNLILTSQGVAILHGATYLIGLGGALSVAYKIKHLGRSWLGVKFASICLAILGTTLSLWFESQSPPAHTAVVILQSLCLGMICVAIIAGLGSRLHLLAFRGTQLLLPELAIVMGGLATAAGSIRAISSTAYLQSGAVDHNRFVGICLLLIGVSVTHQIMRGFTIRLDSLAVDMSKDDDPQALKRIIAYVLESVSRLVSNKFGEEALFAMETRINRGKETPEFTFASIHVPDDASAEEIGQLYRQRFEMVAQAIAGIYGERFSRRVFDLAFQCIHWQCKDVLNTYLFPGSRWEGKYVEDQELDNQRRLELVNAISIFNELAQNERELLVRHTIAQSRKAGDVILKQGDFGDTCYILVKGEVQVEERDSTGQLSIIAFLRNGDFFGESALLSNSPRMASVRTTTDCQLLALSRHDFEKFGERYPEMVHRVKDRLYNLQALLRIPLFGDLSPSLLRAVLPRIRAAHFERGEDIITQGDIGKDLYLVKSGHVDVIIKKGDREEPICELGPREYFGEIALLKDIPRTATVRSKETTEVLVLSKDDFLALASESTLFAKSVELIGTRRLRTV